MKEEKDSFALAKEMVRIGKGAGKKCVAVVSDMDQPLGCAVGNALEVKEAIETLQGKGPADFMELCMTLGARMMILGKKAKIEKTARERLLAVIKNGSALRKLAEFVEAQGGDAAAVYDTSLLPKASLEKEIKADRDGFVGHIACEEVGICSLMLGGGRETKESIIDLSVGIVLRKKVGDRVAVGDTLAVLYANDADKMKAAAERLLRAYRITEEEPEKRSLIKGLVS